jgi:DNA polymerase V
MFALVDCNNFYASCERVFNAKIIHRPVVVLSNNDGCIIARSNEAKALGFKMGDPLFKVRELIDRHSVVVFSSNYTLYGDMSSRVMQTLQGFVPEVEVYSIDEAFLNLSGIASDQFMPLASEIRQRVKQWTGIPVSVGIAATKTLAKAANRFAKKDPASGGCWIIGDEHARMDALSRLPIGDVWGIGPKWAKKLELHGVTTAADFCRQADSWIKQRMNVVGLRTAWELRGEACIPLELAPPPKKGICVSRMFGHRLTEYEPVQQALIAYVTRAGEKLRQDKLHAEQMTVFLHNSPFTTAEPYYGNTASIALPYATSDTAELIRHACMALKRIYRDGYHYAKCGVRLDELSSNAVRQGDLFDQRDTERNSRLMVTLDSINHRMGRDTVFYAGSGIKRDWKAFANMKTQHFTTDWWQLLSIKT